MAKTAEAFRTISEVAGELDVPKHVLRFWEGKFPQVRPMKRGGGRRYYRPEDMELLRGICQLLHAEGYTIKGVQKILREKGVDQVKRFGREIEAKAAAKKEAGSKRGKRTQGRGSRTAKARATAEAKPNSVFCAVVDTPDARELIKSAIAELEACRGLLLEKAVRPQKAARPPAKRKKAAARSRQAAST